MSNETEIKQVPSYNRNGGYVYPHTLQHLQEIGYGISLGITRRDWLAGLAMQGLLSKPSLLANEGEMLEGKVLSVASYEIADAMIAEGKKGE
ncbi:hypothetical protein LCGC14_1009370 [marine sediment metagenome]|uniref:Uncharacterized protein n=1 Tax=marine sediment metagenome TaxID=412755 RepID=A0A0F9R6T6_9ZZZZ|nr:hypothetical protein [Candidatus Aminicenantes bacterium]